MMELALLLFFNSFIEVSLHTMQFMHLKWFSGFSSKKHVTWCKNKYTIKYARFQISLSFILT